MKLDGREIAAKIFQELALKVQKLKDQNITAHLVVLLIGNDPASEAYVRQKNQKAQEIGAQATIINLESRIQNSELLELIGKLNNDPAVHGVIVQRPVPPQINSEELDKAVVAEKDIDSFHPNSPYPMPLAQAVIKILKEVYWRGVTRVGDPHRVPAANARTSDGGNERQDPERDFTDWLKQKQIVVIGKGKTGGGPTIELLRKMGCNVQVIDSKTENPSDVLKQGDIIISAIGKPNSINARDLKQGCIVIQVGMYRGEDGKLHGDFDEAILEQKSLYYTPVPGGIGPVNVACLLENLVKAAKNSLQPKV